jgi:CBS domain-containing protein
MLRLVATRLALPLHVARGKVLNTDYNADPSAYESESVALEELEMADPTGVVGDIMAAKNLRSTQPDSTLRSADSKLDKVTGLPVVDENNVVVGVISKKVSTLQAGAARRASQAP